MISNDIPSILKIVFVSLLFAFPSIGFTQTISYIDDNGNVVIDEEAFLPLGFYCEGMPFGEFGDIPARMDSAGFNILYTESTVGSDSEYQTFLQDCENRGLKNIIGLPYSFIDSTDFDLSVNKLSSYPSVAVWNILDDANDFEVSDIETQRRNLLRLDTTRITLASWYTDDEPFPTMLPYVESAGMQAYPWEDGSGNDLVFVESLWRLTALKAQAANRCAIATPQVFNWDDQSYPAADHIDCQTYIGFITGLKGVLFYTFKDYDQNSTIDLTQAEQFSACSKIADEVLGSELKDAFLLGKHEYHRINFYRYYATWEYNGFLYLIAVNANDDLTYEYSIPMPDFVLGEGENMFDYRPDSLRMSNGQLQGQLAPYQVAIYKFEISTSTTSSTANGNREAKIHPNPGSFVHIESPFESFRIDILSTDGKTMLTTTVQGHNGEVDLSKLPQGIYFCQLTDLKSTQRISKKIIKN